MNVESILKVKGREVETISPEALTVFAVHKLTTTGMGALVVSTDGERLEGVISERDLVRGLSRHGTRLLDMPVAEVMSRRVPVCSPDDSLSQVMAEMTRTRHRHLPVIRTGRLCGLVSIGDIVKHRLEDLELETSVLRDAYRAGR